MQSSIRRWSLLIATLLLFLVCTLVYTNVGPRIMLAKTQVEEQAKMPDISFKNVDKTTQPTKPLGFTSARIIQPKKPLGIPSARIIQPTKPLRFTSARIIQPQKPLGFPSARIFTQDKDVHLTKKVFSKSTSIPFTINSNYLIKNSHLCSQYIKVKYVILIHSATTYFDFRKRQRGTWAKANLFTGINSVTVFVLGRHKSKEIMDKVAKENEEYGDIIQGDFIDVYGNLTLKAVMGMRWLAENCRNAEYVIKADDDTFINAFRLKNVFAVLKENPKQLICSVIDHPPIVRGKSYLGIPNDKLAGLERYPTPICFGFAVFFKYELAIQMAELAKNTPFIKLDDVYFYGIIATKIEGLTWRHVARFEQTEGSSLSHFRKLSLDQMLVGCSKTDKGMYGLWNIVLGKSGSKLVW